MNTMQAIQSYLFSLTSAQLCERLLLGSVELAVLFLAFWILIKVFRIRTARVCALLWLIILAKAAVGPGLQGPWQLWSIQPVQVLAEVEAVAEPEPEVVWDFPVEPMITDLPLPEDFYLDDVPFGDSPASDASFDDALTEFSPFDLSSFDDPILLASEEVSLPSLPEIPLEEVAETPEPVVVATLPVFEEKASAGSVWSRLSVTDWVVGVWLAGVVFMAALTGVDVFRIRRCYRKTAAADGNIVELFRAEAQRMGVARCPRLLVSDRTDSPVLIGMFRPTVLIPRWLARDPNHERLRWILAHELMHCKMRDLFGLAVRRVALTVMWFHPMVWLAGRRWECAMELACDRALIRDVGQAKDYAGHLYGLLENLIERQKKSPATMALFATRTQAGQRIAALLSHPLRSPARLGALTIIGLLVITGLSFSFGIGVAPVREEIGSKTEEVVPEPLEVITLLSQDETPPPAPLAVPEPVLITKGFGLSRSMMEQVLKWMERGDVQRLAYGEVKPVEGAKLAVNEERDHLQVTDTQENIDKISKYIDDLQDEATENIVHRTYLIRPEDGQEILGMIKKSLQPTTGSLAEGFKAVVESDKIILVNTLEKIKQFEKEILPLFRDEKASSRLEVRVFDVIRPQGDTPNLKLDRKFFMNAYVIIETLLYGQEGIEAARAKGRRIWPQRDDLENVTEDFRITLTDTADRLQIVSRYLESITGIGEERTHIAEIKHRRAPEMLTELLDILGLSAKAGVFDEIPPAGDEVTFTLNNPEEEKTFRDLTLRVIRIQSSRNNRSDESAELAVTIAGRGAASQRSLIREYESEMIGDYELTAEEIRPGGGNAGGRIKVRVRYLPPPSEDSAPPEVPQTKNIDEVLKAQEPPFSISVFGKSNALHIVYKDANDLRSILKLIEKLDDPDREDGIDAGEHLLNGSFEEGDAGTASSWSKSTWAGAGVFGIDETGGRDGKCCVSIASSVGVDAAWSQRVKVQPQAYYKASCWIKTRNVESSHEDFGAVFYVYSPEVVTTRRTAPTMPWVGDHDWRKVELFFSTGNYSEVSIGCFLGGGQESSGKVWFDDVELTGMSEEEIDEAESLRREIYQNAVRILDQVEMDYQAKLAAAEKALREHENFGTHGELKAYIEENKKRQEQLKVLLFEGAFRSKMLAESSYKELPGKVLQVRDELDEMLKKGLVSSHPYVQKKRGEVEDSRRRLIKAGRILDPEVEKIGSSLDILIKQQAELSAKISGMKTSSVEEVQARERIRQRLQRKYDMHRSIYEDILERRKRAELTVAQEEAEGSMFGLLTDIDRLDREELGILYNVEEEYAKELAQAEKSLHEYEESILLNDDPTVEQQAQATPLLAEVEKMYVRKLATAEEALKHYESSFDVRMRERLEGLPGLEYEELMSGNTDAAIAEYRRLAREAAKGDEERAALEEEIDEITLALRNDIQANGFSSSKGKKIEEESRELTEELRELEKKTEPYNKQIKTLKSILRSLQYHQPRLDRLQGERDVHKAFLVDFRQRRASALSQPQLLSTLNVASRDIHVDTLDDASDEVKFHDFNARLNGVFLSPETGKPQASIEVSGRNGTRDVKVSEYEVILVDNVYEMFAYDMKPGKGESVASAKVWVRFLRGKRLGPEFMLSDPEKELIYQGLSIRLVRIEAYPPSGRMESNLRISAELNVRNTDGSGSARRLLIAEGESVVVGDFKIFLDDVRPGGGQAGGRIRIRIAHEKEAVKDAQGWNRQAARYYTPPKPSVPYVMLNQAAFQVQIVAIDEKALKEYRSDFTSKDILASLSGSSQDSLKTLEEKGILRTSLEPHLLIMEGQMAETSLLGALPRDGSGKDDDEVLNGFAGALARIDATKITTETIEFDFNALMSRFNAEEAKEMHDLKMEPMVIRNVFFDPDSPSKEDSVSSSHSMKSGSTIAIGGWKMKTASPLAEEVNVLIFLTAEVVD